MKNLKRIEGNKKLDPIKIASTKASNFHNPSRNGRNKKIETTVESNFLKFVKEKRRIERPILFSLETVITGLIGAPSVASDALRELVNGHHRHFLLCTERNKVRSGEGLGVQKRRQKQTLLSAWRSVSRRPK